MKPTIKTLSALRESFWEANPQLAEIPRKDGKDPRDVRQNQKPTDTRCAFVDYVDYLQKDGLISEDLALDATL